MTTLIEAAKAVVARWDSPNWKDQPHTGEFIDALRTAIQEAEQQEPVAWMCPDDPERETAFNWYAGKCDQKGCNAQRIPLYTQPPAAKEWQGLTDEEAMAIDPDGFIEGFARAIEAKLKDKNK